MIPPVPTGRPKIESANYRETAAVITAKGSIYHYLDDGTTTRFKKAENKRYPPQTALVYVPDFSFVKKNAPVVFLEACDNSESGYQQLLLEYVQGQTKNTKIVDSAGNQLTTFTEIENAGNVFLALITKGADGTEKADFIVPVNLNPKVGSYTYDTRYYNDDVTGERVRERHLGNKVIEILKK